MPRVPFTVHRAARLAAAAAALLLAAWLGLASFGPTAQAAPAADRYTFYLDGFRCEMNRTGVLGKAVCRDPYNFGNYMVMYFDFDETKGVVFTDAFWPIGPGHFTIDQQQMSFREWAYRYGPR